ncbi:MAG: DUF5362 family protein [Bacteroidales bacterium]
MKQFKNPKTMEETINQEQTIIEQSNELVVSQTMKSYFLKYAKWGKFLGIVSYISAVMMFILGISFFFIGALTAAYPEAFAMVFKVMMFGLMIVYGIIYVFMGKYLLNSAKQTKLGIEINSQLALEDGVNNLQKLFSLLGVLTIIGICVLILYVIVLVAAIAFFVPAF